MSSWRSTCILDSSTSVLVESVFLHAVGAARASRCWRIGRLCFFFHCQHDEFSFLQYDSRVGYLHVVSEITMREERIEVYTSSNANNM